MTSLVELFCEVDDFCQVFYLPWQHEQLGSGCKKRIRAGQLTLSEMMTIVIHFHQAQYRNFKAYYEDYVQVRLRGEFPKLVSYGRFVQLMPTLAVPLYAYLQYRCVPTRGVTFVDSTALRVCDNRRIERHPVFKGIAQRGKTSMGWFYGFKTHLMMNDQGELVAFHLTPGNVDDRQTVEPMARRLWGKLFGDKGYLSAKLSETLLAQGVQLITHVRQNMKPRQLAEEDRFFLRKRAILETITDQLKNISQIEHSRHRSSLNFVVNVCVGILAYTFQPKKPALHIQLDLLPTHIPA